MKKSKSEKLYTYLTKKNRDELYEKIHHLVGDIQKVIKEQDEPQEAIPVQKTKPAERDADVAYDSKRAVVLNLASVTKTTNRAKEVIIGEGERLIELYRKSEKVNEYSVKSIVGDVTKIINELKSLPDLDPEKKEELERIRKTLRYTVTGIKNANNKIKEIENKRENLERQFLDKKYLEELDRINKEYQQKQEELKRKFKVDSPDTQIKIEKFKEELDRQKKEIKQNATEIENEAKEIIRSIREVIKESYDLPSHVINNVTIYLKTMGVVANIAQKRDSAILTKEGIQKFFEDKEFREFLEGGGWARVQEHADRVGIVGAKMPDLGTYIAEIRAKGEQIIDDIEKDTKSKKKTKEIKTEGVFTQSINQFISSVFQSASMYFNRLKDLFKSSHTSIESEINQVIPEIKELKREDNTIKKELYKQRIDIQKAIKLFEVSILDDASESIE